MTTIDVLVPFNKSLPARYRERRPQRINQRSYLGNYGTDRVDRSACFITSSMRLEYKETWGEIMRRCTNRVVGSPHSSFREGRPRPCIFYSI